MYYKLTEDHEVIKKLNRIFQVMDEEGIIFELEPNKIIIKDKNRKDKKELTLLDNEYSPSGSNSGITQFPPFAEYKVCFEKF